MDSRCDDGLMPAVRPVAASLVVLASIGGVAPPAAAHGGSGIDATNYETRVEAMSPPTPGLRVQAIDLGERLELSNETGKDVVVLGYDDEPYLRVGPRGVFENRRSPATYLNENLELTDARVPDSADPTAAPDWQRVSGGATVRWHDHRAHWMGAEDPPAVRRDRGSRHVVQDWTVELRSDGRPIEVTGDIVWVPGPSPWPWLLAAVALAAVLIATSRLRRWRWPVAAGLVIAMAAVIGHVVGEWGATTASFASTLGQSIYSLGGLALGSAALVLLLTRRDPSDATPALLIAGLVLALGSGLADVTALWHSQLPSTQSAATVRLEVAAALGLGLGLAAAGALRLREGVPGRDVPKGRSGEGDADWTDPTASPAQ